MPTKRPITAEDLYALQFVEDPQISPDGRHVAFVKVTVDKLNNRYERHLWLATPGQAAPRVRQFTVGAKADTAPRWSPDGQTLAFVSARDEKPQIYLIDVNGGEARPLTRHPNGAFNPVWSPDGKRLAFHAYVNVEERRREDAGQAESAPATLLESKQRAEIKADAEKQKSDPRLITRLPYRTGTEFLDDRFAHIYVIDVPADDAAEPQPYRLTDGDEHFGSAVWSRGSGHLDWTPDGRFILTMRSATPEHDPNFNSEIIRLMVSRKRKAPRRLSPPGDEYYNPLASPDGQWIAAQRTPSTGSFGCRAALVVMPAEGGPARDLTLDFDRSVDAFCWAADSKTLYLQAGDHGDVSVYRVARRGGAAEKVVGGRRMVTGFGVSRAGQIAFTAHAPDRPADVYLASGEAETRLTDFNARWLREVHVAAMEELTYRASDGREIQGWLLKPFGYRRRETYPLAVNMHGGPHVMWGPSMPGMWLEWQLHAARGYVVFYCNPRGSEGYGEAFTTIIQNDWGDHVMHDILAGVDVVLSRGFVDETRIALTGGSYAGYLTAWMVGRCQRFACAWAQRGLYSLLGFYGTTDVPQLIEREFEMLPFDDVEKAWQQSPLAYVRDIHTPLAIEHQDQDYRCPVSEAEQLFAALKRLKRDVLFVRYPREGHEMSRGGEPAHRIDRLNRMTDWFDTYCRKKRKRG